MPVLSEFIPSFSLLFVLPFAYKGDRRYFNLVLFSVICELSNLFDFFYFAGRLDKPYLTYTWLLPVYVLVISDLFVRAKYYNWLILSPVIVFLSSVSIYYNLTVTQAPPLPIYQVPLTLCVAYTAILAVTALMLYYRSGNKNLDPSFLIVLILLSCTEFIKYESLDFTTPLWKITINAYCGILFNVILIYVVLKDNRKF